MKAIVVDPETTGLGIPNHNNAKPMLCWLSAHNQGRV
jgi:hypothetical protein